MVILCHQAVGKIEHFSDEVDSAELPSVNNNINNEHISRAHFHVKHAQLRWTGANTKIENACI